MFHVIHLSGDEPDVVFGVVDAGVDAVDAGVGHCFFVLLVGFLERQLVAGQSATSLLGRQKAQQELDRYVVINVCSFVAVFNALQELFEKDLRLLSPFNLAGLAIERTGRLGGSEFLVSKLRNGFEFLAVMAGSQIWFHKDCRSVAKRLRKA